MRRGILNQGSDLIQSVGWDDGKMEVKYKADGKIFLYSGVPLRVFSAIVRSKAPGTTWLKVRDKFGFEEVK